MSLISGSTQPSLQGSRTRFFCHLKISLPISGLAISTLQLANTYIIQANISSSLSALESGFLSASHICFPELQMFFTASMLHIHIMQWINDYSVEVQRCDEIWQTISSDRTDRCPGLFFYNEMLHVFYRIRLCDYKNAQHHVDRLDQAMNAYLHKMQEIQQLLDELSSFG